jgi:hypothetical protein
MYPSPYCFITLNELENRKNNFVQKEAACENADDGRCWKLTTYGDLRKSYEKFCTIGKDKKFAKECDSS